MARPTRQTPSAGVTAVERALLVARALAAAYRAYAPYSRYRVGAALMTDGGEILDGCNVENAAYPLCICAERVALGTAVAAGHRAFRAIAVATRSSPPATPCGACRQVLHELGAGMDIILCNHLGEVRRTTVADLLPQAFGTQQLRRGAARSRSSSHSVLKATGGHARRTARG